MADSVPPLLWQSMFVNTRERWGDGPFEKVGVQSID